MSETILAIDPGINGGIVYSPLAGKDPVAMRMPETVHDLVDVLKSASFEKPVRAVVELVGGYIGKAQPASSAFVFGEGYGKIQGVLAALEIPFDLVRPQAWQKALSLGTSTGMSKTAWKGKLRAKAQQLYPGIKVTLATADALLIYHAARLGKI